MRGEKSLCNGGGGGGTGEVKDPGLGSKCRGFLQKGMVRWKLMTYSLIGAFAGIRRKGTGKGMVRDWNTKVMSEREVEGT